jgi:hypothetical protein
MDFLTLKDELELESLNDSLEIIKDRFPDNGRLIDAMETFINKFKTFISVEF